MDISVNTKKRLGYFCHQFHHRNSVGLIKLKRIELCDFALKKKKIRNFDFALSLRRKSKVLTHRFPDFGGGERGTGIFHFKPPISYSILRLLESLARNPYSSTSKIRFCGFLNFLRFLGSSESLGSSLLQWERRNSSILESIATWRIAIFLISCHSPVIDANRQDFFLPVSLVAGKLFQVSRILDLGFFFICLFVLDGLSAWKLWRKFILIKSSFNNSGNEI